MRLQAILNSVLVLLLNMCNILELSGLFVYQRGLVHIFSIWETEKIDGLWFARGISTQSDPGFSEIILFNFVSFFINENLALTEH